MIAKILTYNSMRVYEFRDNTFRGKLSHVSSLSCFHKSCRLQSLMGQFVSIFDVNCFDNLCLFGVLGKIITFILSQEAKSEFFFLTLSQEPILGRSNKQDK